MDSLTDKIMRRIRAHGRGKWVCTPKDFLDLGSRAAVDQALSRLVKSDTLRRIGRGLYDLPRMSGILKRPAPPNVDAAIDAVVKRDRIQVLPDGIVAANQLGLTNAVPAKTAFVTNGATRTLKIGGRTVQFRHIGRYIMRWVDRPGAQVIQALAWLGKAAASDASVIDTLRSCLPDLVKQDLMKSLDTLPHWMANVVKKISIEQSVLA